MNRDALTCWIGKTTMAAVLALVVYAVLLRITPRLSVLSGHTVDGGSIVIGTAVLAGSAVLAGTWFQSDQD